jgi:hypothetical protein
VPLYQVEVIRTSAALVYIDAADEELAAEIALQDPPEEEQFEDENISVGDIDEVEDTDGLTVFVHNGARRGERVSDWMDDDSED